MVWKLPLLGNEGSRHSYSYFTFEIKNLKLLRKFCFFVGYFKVNATSKKRTIWYILIFIPRNLPVSIEPPEVVV